MKRLFASLGRILVKDSTENDRSKGGILIANTDGVKCGTILDLFLTTKQLQDEDNALDAFSEIYGVDHPAVSIGTTIYYHDNSGYKITYQGEEVRVLNYSDILAIETDEETEDLTEPTE